MSAIKKIICFFLIVIILPLQGCIEKKQKVSLERDYTVYSIEKLPSDLDLIGGDNNEGEELLYSLFEGLVKIDNETKDNKAGKIKIAPGIAEKWEISKDGCHYNFKIRNDAAWSDGTPITANDFVGFFSAILSPHYNNKYAEELYCIVGAKDFNQGKTGDFSKVAISASEDGRTLSIGLYNKDASLIDILSEPQYCLRQFDENLIKWKSSYNKIKYSGAYTINNVADNKNVMLVKNGMYWDKGNIRSSKICITTNDNNAAMAAFEPLNSVDVFSNPPASEYENLLNNKQVAITKLSIGAALKFNLKNSSAGSNKNFRKAINESINRKDLCSKMGDDFVRAALSYIPDTTNGAPESGNLLRVNENRTQALEYLKQSNLPVNQAITIVYLDTTENNKISSYIIDNIRQVIDNSSYSEMVIRKKPCDEEQLRKLINNDEYDILLTDYKGDYDSPEAFLTQWETNSQYNVTGYDNYIYNGLMDTMRIGGEPNKRVVYGKAQTILLDDMVIIPLFFKNLITCKKNYIHDLSVDKNGNVIINSIYPDEEKIVQIN
ncbi:MAG: peptide ABC transporter substrate-binding protein [Bacillota bacterium]|nr:peptide ABC transporter substrate-binding protein [Bacillota bacterium]